MMPGFGSQNYGATPYGIGQPSDVNPNGGFVLRDQYSDEPRGSRRIDPRSRDYVMNAFGRIRGMNDVQQLVLLAVSTERGSSSVRDLGHELKKIDRITSNFVRRVDSTFRLALQHLVDRQLIEVVAVTVEVLPTPGRAYINVRWRDLKNKVEHTEEVG